MDSIAQTKNYTKGQEVVDYRIDSAMTHYEGRVAHWDIINEIIHGQVDLDTNDANNPTIGTLKALTGREDNDIFKYVLDKAAAIDPDAKFCINDYNLLTQWSDKAQFIPMVKGLVNQGCKVDIIGCEGHFGETVDIGDFTTKLNDMASNFPNQEIWMTEVDFKLDMAQVPMKLADLLTTCFANENVHGFLIWTPWQGNLWRSDYTSYLFDSSFVETPMALKWLELIDGWTTPVQQATTDAEGKHSFNGFYGKYKVTFEEGTAKYEGFVNFKPGNDNTVTLQKSEMIPDTVKPDYPVEVRSFNSGNDNGTRKRTIVVNSGALSFSIPAYEDGQLYLSAYSLSGRLLARVPLSFSNGVSAVHNLPAGCHVYRIGTDHTNYKSSMGLNLR